MGIFLFIYLKLAGVTVPRIWPREKGRGIKSGRRWEGSNVPENRQILIYSATCNNIIGMRKIGEKGLEPSDSDFVPNSADEKCFIPDLKKIRKRKKAIEASRKDV